MQIAYKHHSNHLILERSADEIRLLGLFPEKAWPREGLQSGRLMQIRLREAPRAGKQADTADPVPSQLALVSMFEDNRVHGELIVIILKDSVTGLLAEVNYLLCSHSPTIRTWLRVRNDGSTPILLETIHATILYNLAAGGWSPGLDRTYVHLWYSGWYGEGQWQKLPLHEVGCLARWPLHQHSTAAEGGWASVTVGMLEDVETKTIWYWQVEPSSSCYWEFGEDTEGKLYVLAGETGSPGGGWNGQLAPGEALGTMPVTFGCVQGGRREALTALGSHYQNIAWGLGRGQKNGVSLVEILSAPDLRR